MKRNDLHPHEKGLALKYKSLTGKSIERCFKFAKRNYNKYIEAISKHPEIQRYMEIKEKYIYKELIFQGFVPVSKFKRNPSLSYLVSRGTINGVRLIYPVHGASNFHLMKNGVSNIWKILGEAGVEGWVKLDLKG